MSALTEKYLAIGRQAAEIQQKKAAGMGGPAAYSAPKTGPDAYATQHARQKLQAIDSELKVLESAEHQFVCRNIKPRPLGDTEPVKDENLMRKADPDGRRSS